MSLINEALKKAQKQRTGESPPLSAMPGVGGKPAAQIARRAKPIGFNALLIRLALGTGAFLVLVAGGYFALHALRHRSGKTSPDKPVAVVSTALPSPEVAPTKDDTFVLPIATTPPAPVVVKHPLVAATKPAAPIPPPTPAQPPAPPAPPKLQPEIITYIDNLRIAGIRASATDSKVLMNDRVYRIGDIVDHTLGLKLTGITANSLAFEDERGASYTRQF